MGGRYECQLPEAALRKAVEELNEPEDNAVRLAAIDRLRTRFQEEVEDLDLLRTDDHFILRFLRVRKFNEDAAFKTLVNYHRTRKEWREAFELVENPKSIEKFLRTGPYIPLKERAKDGTFVTVGRSGRYFDDCGGTLEYFAAGVLTVEKLLENEEVQIYGATVIEDLRDFGMHLVLKQIQYGKQMVRFSQDALPIRLKCVNVVNEALVFDVVYAALSPFMKEKLKKRIKLHGTDYKGLQQHLDAEHLPTFLGGDAPEPNIQHWADQILSTVGGGEETAL